MTRFAIDPKTKGILEAIRCPRHKKYRAIRKPAVKCKTCWKLYRLKEKKS